jgi:hypothetical protein
MRFFLLLITVGSAWGAVVDYSAALSAVQSATMKQTGAEKFLGDLQGYAESHARKCIDSAGLTPEAGAIGAVWMIYKTRQVQFSTIGIKWSINQNTVSASRSFPLP